MNIPVIVLGAGDHAEVVVDAPIACAAIGARERVVPGVTLSCGVRVGDNVHIGSGSTVLPGVTLGDDCIVGARSVVLAEIPPGHKVAGVSAVRLKT